MPVEDNVEALNNAFKTNPDLKFTLNQNKIIELLMGTQLYQDPYACLRELYQNSLDASRCAIARRKNLGEVNPKCTIEFGVKEDKEHKGGKYLYCLDDGKGMSEYIIENYFLNIGSSYYKSKDFYSEWAHCGFTPTSQFGIGILSCFMIGERLEVLTKEYNGELIAFGVDGPQETFYYWKSNKHISPTDKEIIEKQGSGTLVKVYLKEQYAKEIDDGELNKLELLKCCDFYSNKLDYYDPSNSTNEEENKYVNLFKRWKRHIYKKVFDFVQLPFPEIAVQVRCANALYSIVPRPHLADVDLATFEKDKKYYDKYSSGYWGKNSDLAEYPISISHSNFMYHSMLYLPTKEKSGDEYNEYVYSGLCVDGVSLGSANDFEEDKFEDSLSSLALRGIFNFVGEHKPAVKIDRCSFVSSVHIENPEQLFSDYLDKVIRVTNEHIKKYRIQTGSPLCQKIWDRVISHLPLCSQMLLANHYDKKGYSQIYSFRLSSLMGENNTAPSLMSMESIKIPRNSRHLENDVFLIKKLCSVQSVTITHDGELQLAFGKLPKLPCLNSFFNNRMCDYVVGLPEDLGPYQDYDILMPGYPLVSHRFVKALYEFLVVESGACIGRFHSSNLEFYDYWYRSSRLEHSIFYLEKITRWRN